MITTIQLRATQEVSALLFFNYFDTYKKFDRSVEGATEFFFPNNFKYQII